MDELPDGIFDEAVWEEVYVEQAFAFVWPTIEETTESPQTDPPTDPPPEPVTVIHHVIAVSADEWPVVEYDLVGVRGAYRMCPLFSPVIHFVTHDQEYLYEYLADLTQYKLVPYTCTYSNRQVVTYIIRVWNDYSIGRDWIISRIAYEQARAAALSDRSTLPEPPELLCLL